MDSDTRPYNPLVGAKSNPGSEKRPMQRQAKTQGLGDKPKPMSAARKKVQVIDVGDGIKLRIPYAGNDG